MRIWEKKTRREQKIVFEKLEAQSCIWGENAESLEIDRRDCHSATQKKKKKGK